MSQSFVSRMAGRRAYPCSWRLAVLASQSNVSMFFMGQRYKGWQTAATRKLRSYMRENQYYSSMRHRLSFVLFVLLFLSLLSYGQSPAKRDSLLAEMHKNKKDSPAVMVYLKYGELFESANP